MGLEMGSGQTIGSTANHQENRRRAQRFDLDMRLLVRPKKDRTRLIHARIIDLSCGGIRAAIAAELEPGETLELEFGLRHTTAVVRLVGIVRWRASYQYGVEFVFVTVQDRERMRQAFATLTPSAE